MNTATFEKNGKTIKATAIDAAGKGFLSNLVWRGWYTEEESYDLCYEYENYYVTIEEL